VTLLQSLFPEALPSQKCKTVSHGYGSVDVYGCSLGAHASAGMLCSNRSLYRVT
jgi:hypothetical protein